MEFGGVSIPFTIQSSQAITLVTPGPDPDGTVAVSVTTPDGDHADGPGGHFHLRLTGSRREQRLAAERAQGQPVTITGSRFVKKGTTVDFGPNPATSVTVKNSRTITADAPAGSGTVDITVTDAKGTSSTSSADEFSYPPES